MSLYVDRTKKKKRKKKNLEMGSMTGAIIRNFASIQQDPGAGEPGGPGRMWGPWICEFVLGFLTFALVWSG